MTTDPPRSLVRSEEQLTVTTGIVPIERIRLEKFIVSEERTITVTVRREQVRLIRETITDQDPIEVDRGAWPGDNGPVEHTTMVLHEEQPIITMHAVPTERVWLERTKVTQSQTINETLRHEQIDVTTN